MSNGNHTGEKHQSHEFGIRAAARGSAAAHLVPAGATAKQAAFADANEADLLNVTLIARTAKQFEGGAQ